MLLQPYVIVCLLDVLSFILPFYVFRLPLSKFFSQRLYLYILYITHRHLHDGVEEDSFSVPTGNSGVQWPADSIRLHHPERYQLHNQDAREKWREFRRQFPRGPINYSQSRANYVELQTYNSLHNNSHYSPDKGKKAKFSHTRYRALGPELMPVYRQSARRGLEGIHPAVGCHYFPPGLRLPSQPKSVTAHRPVPNYTALWQRHMRVSSLPKVVTWKRTGRDSNSQSLGSGANDPTPRRCSTRCTGCPFSRE